MTVVSLAPWLPASSKPKRHLVIDAVEHILHRACPLPRDMPEGRLLVAITALAEAEHEHDAWAAAAERHRIAG